jgi:hypothetical protein
VAKSFHLLTATPESIARFWVEWIHEVRVVGHKGIDLLKLAKQCDTFTGEILMVLPLTQDEAGLQEAIAAVRAEWEPLWLRHINLVSEVAIAMAKHRDEQEGVFQTFIQALQALPDTPAFDAEAVMQQASVRAHGLLEEREWEYGKLWDIREVPSRELPWILAEAVWDTQLDDALTLLHIWRVTHYIGLEGMADGYRKPPAVTLMPFPVSVTGVGFSLEATLEMIERFRLYQKKNLELNFLLMIDVLMSLRFIGNPYELMMRISAVMPKPLDIDAEMKLVRKRRKRRESSKARDDIPAELIDELTELVKDMPWVYEERAAIDETLPKSNFLTQDEVNSLLAPLSKPRRKQKPK